VDNERAKALQNLVFEALFVWCYAQWCGENTSHRVEKNYVTVLSRNKSTLFYFVLIQAE